VDKIGYIEIRVTGSKGNLAISPDNLDIREIIPILENAENLLFPVNKKDRPSISYSIEEGSVRHVFKISMQYVIGFNAVLGQIVQEKAIDFLELNTAKAFENIQQQASKNNYSFIIKTCLDLSNEVCIDKNTRYYRKIDTWVDAEFYFYGKITHAGGKEKGGIHLLTEEFGTIRIETPILFLEQYDENLLYKKFGIRATGKQHTVTGDIDVSSLFFVELIEFQPRYDQDYLKRLRDKAKKSWLEHIDAPTWLNEMRGDYDA
jgi:hypothetical protein